MITRKYLIASFSEFTVPSSFLPFPRSRFRRGDFSQGARDQSHVTCDFIDFAAADGLKRPAEAADFATFHSGDDACSPRGNRHTADAAVMGGDIPPKISFLFETIDDSGCSAFREIQGVPEVFDHKSGVFPGLFYRDELDERKIPAAFSVYSPASEKQCHLLQGIE
ncbi:MAG: hypothetical protein PHF93_05620 [Acidobacteriota bacterium]|nr:hypothetical protein [Acidobacteriota bacterium]MDD8033282.1 hypothetical protein [Acidobacteriota bacterium]MDW3225878.1 hypothetical protein [Acidobacteriota bacterium]